MVVGRLAVAHTPMIGLPAQRRFRHAQREAVDVEPGEAVDTGFAQIRATQEIEHSQVEEERIVGLTREDRRGPPTSLKVLTPAPRPPCGADRPTLSYRRHRSRSERRAAVVDPRDRAVWYMLRFALSTPRIGPVLYRNVLGFRTCEVNRNW